MDPRSRPEGAPLGQDEIKERIRSLLDHPDLRVQLQGIELARRALEPAERLSWALATDRRWLSFSLVSEWNPEADRYLYTYALDCVAHAIERETRRGLDPGEPLRQAFAVAVDWVGGRASQEALEAAASTTNRLYGNLFRASILHMWDMCRSRAWCPERVVGRERELESARKLTEALSHLLHERKEPGLKWGPIGPLEVQRPDPLELERRVSSALSSAAYDVRIRKPPHILYPHAKDPTLPTEIAWQRTHQRSMLQGLAESADALQLALPQLRRQY